MKGSTEISHVRGLQRKRSRVRGEEIPRDGNGPWGGKKGKNAKQNGVPSCSGQGGGYLYVQKRIKGS